MLVPDVAGTGTNSGTWGADGTILLGTGTTSPLRRLSAGGGAPVVLAPLGFKEIGHLAPFFLPGGRQFLFFARAIVKLGIPKVVVGAAGRALYFSRRTIPYLRDAASRPAAEQLATFPFLKHLGIYGFRREALLRLVKFPVSPLENAEKLEQLRALDNGIQIAVVKVDYDSVGVDLPEDVARVEKLLAGGK